jgi:hypothetical protein
MEYLLILSAALFLVGCSTVGKFAPALTEAAVQNLASYELGKNPDAIPYLQAATPIICNLAGQGVLEPAKVVAALDNSSIAALKTPTAALIINGVLTIYETVYNTYSTNIETSVVQPYLLAVCDGLEAALPNPTPTVRKYKEAVLPGKWVFVK